MTRRGLTALALALVLPSALAACGDDGATIADARTIDASADAASDAGPDGPPPARPHPLYPALDLDDLPGDGGAAGAPYRPPTLPATTRAITLTSTGAQAGLDLAAACATAGTAVTVPDGAGALGTVFLGNATDCDVTLGARVVIGILYVGHVNTPAVAPAHRVRLRGGQLGQLLVDPGSTDLVFDGVVINNAVVAPFARANTAIYLIGDRTGVGPVVERFALVRSIVRMMPTTPNGTGDTDGAVYLAQGARDVFFADDNLVSGGNRNAWGFLVGGGKNLLLVDLAVRVSIDKLVRLEDAAIDYVWIKGGTWMRQATTTSGGATPSDSFAQRDDRGTDHVYLHDLAVYLLPPTATTFGASTGAGQVGKRWEARRLAWHARDAAVVSDARLTALQSGCAAGAFCDYGVGSHSYAYEPALTLPMSPWRDLPSFADDDPDHQPVAP